MTAAITSKTTTGTPVTFEFQGQTIHGQFVGKDWTRRLGYTFTIIVNGRTEHIDAASPAGWSMKKV